MGNLRLTTITIFGANFMKRWMILALILALASAAKADVVSTFEDLGLPVNSFNNNLGTNGFFNSGGNSFNNSYDPTFGVWSGWSISSQNQVPTLPPPPANGSYPPSLKPDYTYQYLAITGQGGDKSQTYAVANTYGAGADPFHPATSIVNLAAGTSPVSIQITNTAYDVISMTYGDGFAKKFGAGDYLLLTIAGYSSANGTDSKVGEVDFYLANFLGSDPSQYYIVNTWQTVDLSSLIGAQSLVFGLESTDNNPTFGMNTPAEFAADNLIAGATAVPEPSGFLLCLTGIGIGGGVLIARRSKGQSTQP